jgi:serine protease Do
MRRKTFMTRCATRAVFRNSGFILCLAALAGAPACAEEQPRARQGSAAEDMQVRGTAQPSRSLPPSILDQPPRQPLDPEVQQSLQHARALSRAFQHASQTIAPSVVHIVQQRQIRVMRNIFDPGEQRLAPTGTGSGFVITPDGYIVTNHHVIAGAERVTVRLNDGREFAGTIIGTDPATDLGVVKIEAENLVAARFGNSDILEVGEWVLAVGSPFGVFANTVTAGIVSAKGRRGLAAPTDSTDRFEDFIQTDAAINPGNSGGPLVTLEGDVIGINSQIATRTGGSVGIGFAIPSAIASFVVDSLIANGRVERGWLGVTGPGEGQMGREHQQLLQSAGVEPGAGALITGIVAGGPADRSGLQPGDVVVRFNGRPISDFGQFRNIVAFTPPGTSAPMTVVRNGESRRIDVTISDTIRGRALLPGGSAFPRYGFTVATLPRQLARQIGVEGGVFVDELEPLGPAAETVLQRGDVIIRVNRAPTPNQEAFDRVIQNLDGTEPIRVDVLRPSTRATGFVEIVPRN